MGTIQSSPEKNCENKLSMTTYLSPNALQAQLIFWTEELTFYQYLLSWSLFDCAETAKEPITSLLTQISLFLESDLPTIKTDLDILKSKGQRSSYELETRFQQIEIQLKLVKLQIFQHSVEFVKLRIC